MSDSPRFQRTRRCSGAAGIAAAQLRRQPLRTVLAVTGVTLAVLAVTLLAATGAGVLEVGATQFDQADRDLWASAEGTSLSPARGGGFTNTLTDSHQVANEIEAHPDVAYANPMAFQSVYIDAGGGDFQTVIGAGINGTGNSVAIQSGRDFSAPNRHYANGSYDGEMTYEVILDSDTADQLDVGVGDTVRIGGSLAAAREHEFTVVAISPTFRQLLGSQTVILPIAELQQVTGTTERDPATFVTAVTEEGVDPATVEAELEAEHPTLSVRTNEEQLLAVLRQRASVLVAGAALVIVAVLAGLTLTASLLWLYVHHQRATFAALLAQGVSPWTVVATITVQALGIAMLGALVGILLAIPAGILVSRVAAALVGFSGLVSVAPWMLGLGAGIALLVGTIVAIVATGGLLRGGMAVPRN